jgi:hypothetical protein
MKVTDLEEKNVFEYFYERKFNRKTKPTDSQNLEFSQFYGKDSFEGIRNRNLLGKLLLINIHFL